MPFLPNVACIQQEPNVHTYEWVIKDQNLSWQVVVYKVWTPNVMQENAITGPTLLYTDFSMHGFATANHSLKKQLLFYYCRKTVMQAVIAFLS